MVKCLCTRTSVLSKKMTLHLGCCPVEECLSFHLPATSDTASPRKRMQVAQTMMICSQLIYWTVKLRQQERASRLRHLAGAIAVGVLLGEATRAPWHPLGVQGMRDLLHVLVPVVIEVRLRRRRCRTGAARYLHPAQRAHQTTHIITQSQGALGKKRHHG